MKQLVGLSNQQQLDYFDNSLHLRCSKEVFRILLLSQEVSVSLGHEPCDEFPTTFAASDSADEISVLHLLLHSSRQISQYSFLSRRQQSRFAILPVHTSAEQDIFLRIHMDNFLQDSSPNWAESARLWSQKVNGSSIFYKTPEDLKSYFEAWKQKRMISKSQSISTVKFVHATRSRIQAVARNKNAPALLTPVSLTTSNASYPAMDTIIAGWLLNFM